jgi:hypothetical protein
MKARTLLLPALALCLIAWGLALLPEPIDDNAELKHYCEMVQLFQTSNGEYGWPDFNNNAHLCEEYKP